MARYKLVFYAPRFATKDILRCLFEKFPRDLGKKGNYEQCAFITPGTGQFKPMAMANPTIGQPGRLEYVEEDRVEIYVEDDDQHQVLKSAINELKVVHPYEEVAYNVYRLEDL